MSKPQYRYQCPKCKYSGKWSIFPTDMENDMKRHEKECKR